MKPHQIHTLNNRLRRLTKRERDTKNPLNPRQALRLNELRSLGLGK
jgi:hypothetical protein